MVNKKINTIPCFIIFHFKLEKKTKHKCVRFFLFSSNMYINFNISFVNIPIFQIKFTACNIIISVGLLTLKHNGFMCRKKVFLKMFTANSAMVFTYYFIYKFIQQNIFIEIIQNKEDIVIKEIFSRIFALIINLLNTVILEIYFPTRTIKKIVLSVYTSILIILLYIFKDIGINEISFFLLNLTLCEAIIYNEFLLLWQIQLCLELAIFANYTTKFIALTINGNFLPIYVLWISSILLSNTRIHKPRRRKSHLKIKLEKYVQRSVLRAKIKGIIYLMMQILLMVANFLLGCKTIRNNIFTIFYMENFSIHEILILMLIICSITLCSVIVPKLNKPTKILIILILILINYIIAFFLKQISNNVNLSHFNGFLLNIFIKKILSFCKCCIISMVTHDANDITYRNNYKFRLLKFLILNADSISFILNTYIDDTVNINFINIFIVLFIIICYNIFINL